MAPLGGMDIYRITQKIERVVTYALPLWLTRPVYFATRSAQLFRI